MMRKLPFLAIIVSLLACNTLLPPPATPTPSADWQSPIAGMASMQPRDVPEHLAVDNPVKTGGEFDVNQYFTVLTHLSMEPGYALDYVYVFDGLGGYPALYSRGENDAPFSAYPQTVGDSPGDFMNHVQTDGSAEGFYEFVVLRVMANQFYLWWHANYNDTRIVASGETLDDIIAYAESSDFGQSMTDETRREAQALDLEPKVEFSGNAVTVTIITFTKWGGFSRETFTINRNFPHTPVGHDSELLAPYDCGVMF